MMMTGGRVGALIMLFLLAGCGAEKAAQPEMKSADPAPCANSGNILEVNKCLADRAAASEARMQKALARNLEEAAQDDRDIGDPGIKLGNVGARKRVDGVKSSQAAWEKYREAHCRLEGYKAMGGSGEISEVSACYDRMNLQRLKDLRSPLTVEGQRSEPLSEE